MKTKLLLIFVLAGSSLFARSRFFVSVEVGVPVAGYGYGYGYYAPPPPPVVAYAPAYPRSGYTWVDGYWYPVGPRYAWHAGYWARPPYRGAVWVGPRYYGHRYYGGYWRR